MPLEPSHPLPPNLLSPLRLDAMSEQWPVQQADALVCINTIHITPWEACKGLMTGAERILRSGGVLYLYGPYQIDGRHTAQSNEEFDAWLRTQNAQWGVRDLAEVTALAILLPRLLAPVYGWFTEGFDTLDLKEAKALLEELAA
jgi:hypothetical protein